MHPARPQAEQRVPVSGGAVPGMLLEPIAREFRPQFHHQSVPRHLGNDRGGGDRQAALIATDDAAHRTRQRRRPGTVDERHLRRPAKHAAQGFHRAAHRQQRGLQDVEPIDLVHARLAETDAGELGQDFGDAPAPRRRNALGIVNRRCQLCRQACAIQDHGGSHYRPGPRPAADLVDAADESAGGVLLKGFQFQREIGHAALYSAHWMKAQHRQQNRDGTVAQQRSRFGRPGRRRTPATTSGTALEVVIEAVGARGDGMAAGPHGRLYVPLTALGDRVRVQPLQARGDGFACELLEVIEPGPERTQPPCPHFGRCGGCSLQHLNDSAYVAWKEQRLDQALARAGLVPEVRDSLFRVPAGSRRRATFAAVHTKAGIVFGFAVRRGHEIVDLVDCPVMAPPIAHLLPRLRSLLAHLRPPGGRCEVAVARLEGESGPGGAQADEDGELDVVFTWPEPPSLAVREALATFADEADLARVSWRASVDVPAEPIACQRPIGAKPGGIFAPVPPGGFLQATAAGEATLIAAVSTGVDGAATVADLFAGAGTFSLPLAWGGVRVHAVDADATALAALNAAARRMQPPVTLPTTDVRDLALRPLAEVELNRYEAVVFDPPRAGAAAQAEALARSRVPTVIAVSCNPDSFARDARLLAAGGYRLQRITPVDQFLWSAHLELAACFRR